MKKLLILTLILALAFALVACGSTGGSENETDSYESQTSESYESSSQSNEENESNGQNSEGDESGSITESNSSESEKESESNGQNSEGDESGSNTENNSSESEKESESQKPDETDYGKIYVKLYFSTDVAIEKTYKNDNDGICLTEIFVKLAEITAKEFSLSEYAVYNVGEEITDENEVFYFTNYLSIIYKDAMVKDGEMILVNYTGVDQSGTPIQGEIILNDGAVSLMDVISQMGLYPSFDSFYYTVYGEKVGGIGEDGYLKYDYNSVIIFASTEIIVSPIYELRVSLDGYELSARFEKAPTLQEVIKAIGFEENYSDYLWIVNGNVEENYQTPIGLLGESIKAEKKKIGAYISFVDEMGMEVFLQPTGNFIEKNTTTVGEILDFYGIAGLEGYSWEVEYQDENGNTVRVPASEDFVINYVYESNTQNNGYYTVNLYGKTSAMTIEISGYLIGEGDVYQSITYTQPVSVREIFVSAGISVDFEDLYVSVMPKDNSGGYQIESLDEIISTSATLVINDQREYVTVNAQFNGVWEIKEVLLDGMTTIGEVLSAVGLNYSDCAWTIYRQGPSLYEISVPVTSENDTVQTYDKIKGESLESVKVFFYCMDYGYVETDDGSGYKDYSKNDVWDNPTIDFSYSDDIFTFIGWSFEQSTPQDKQKPQAIKSIEEIFAKNVLEIEVFPIIEFNLEAFNGLYQFYSECTYLKIENGFAYGFYFDGTGYNVCTQYTKEQISLEYEYGQVYATVYGYRYNLDIYQKQQDSIIYVENNEGNGIVSCTVINTKEDLKNYYIDFAKSYVIVDLNGNTVELEQIVDGEIYYVYLQSAQI